VQFDFNVNFKISTLNNRFLFHILHELSLLAMNPRHETLITKVLCLEFVYLRYVKGFFFLWEPRMLKGFRCFMFQLKSQPSFYCVCNQNVDSLCVSCLFGQLMKFWNSSSHVSKSKTDFETHLNLEIWYSYLYVESGALCALDVLSCSWNYNPPSNCTRNHLKTRGKILLFGTLCS